MLLNRITFLQQQAEIALSFRHGWKNICGFSRVHSQITKLEEDTKQDGHGETVSYIVGVNANNSVNHLNSSKTPVVPITMTKKEPTVLSFDEVPGPKTLKYLSNVRQYLSEFGTQVTARVLTFGISFGTYIETRKSFRTLSNLFDEYGPVVRFISPVGRDIVLINHPDHIQKVFAMEGEHPVRSTLDSLEKYRTENQTYVYGGLYNVQGKEWNKQRNFIYPSLQNALTQSFDGIHEICDAFTHKVYNLRNHQDEIPKDLFKEIHKWAFDCMGMIIFAKKFHISNKEHENSQCDMTWLYNSLVNATSSIVKCESGLQMWKLFNTPAWNSLVKNCDNVNSLIGKHVIEIEQSIASAPKLSSDETNMELKGAESESLISSILLGQKMRAEDVATIIMDMLLIGVNTISSSMAFLLYNLANSQKYQKRLYQEIEKAMPNFILQDAKQLDRDMPYLQACIKETLRLVPPIPVLTRVLQSNITLDNYNIPRGTLIIMSTKDSSLKEGNYDDAHRFYPDRWLKLDAIDYHTFASIPFGSGARKCLGQNISEVMLSLLTMKLIQKYRLEYHYGEIKPTRDFIAKPNKALKIRFIDRYKNI